MNNNITNTNRNRNKHLAGRVRVLFVDSRVELGVERLHDVGEREAQSVQSQTRTVLGEEYEAMYAHEAGEAGGGERVQIDGRSVGHLEVGIVGDAEHQIGHVQVARSAQVVLVVVVHVGVVHAGRGGHRHGRTRRHTATAVVHLLGKHDDWCMCFDE